MLWTSSSSLTFSKQINCTRTEALNLFYDHEAFILLNGLAVSVEKISDDGTIAKFKFTERPVLFGPIKATITPTSTICRVEDGQDVHTKAPMGVQVWLKWRVQTIADGGIEVNAAVTAEAPLLMMSNVTGNIKFAVPDMMERLATRLEGREMKTKKTDST